VGVISIGCEMLGSGGDSSSVQSNLQQVVSISATDTAFAARRKDGRVVTWGHKGKHYVGLFLVVFKIQEIWRASLWRRLLGRPKRPSARGVDQFKQRRLCTQSPICRREEEEKKNYNTRESLHRLFLNQAQQKKISGQNQKKKNIPSPPHPKSGRLNDANH